jgi:N-acylneuraminate cytidylyltransferase
VYRPNGAVYVFDADWYRSNGNLLTDRIGVIEMDERSSLDIDSSDDFLACEEIMRQRKALV